MRIIQLYSYHLSHLINLSFRATVGSRYHYFPILRMRKCKFREI